MDHRPRSSPSTWQALRAFMLAFALLLAPAAPGALASDAPLPRWTGGIDLYRAGTFSTQKTWYWCTAADVQIMRNIARGTSNRSRNQQRRFFRYMRTHDRDPIPLRDGVDPAGWAAGLRRFVDPRYRLVASSSFRSALRSAVRSLRRTNQESKANQAMGTRKKKVAMAGKARMRPP